MSKIELTMVDQWTEFLKKHEVSAATYPTPDSWHDLKDELEYWRLSYLDTLTDHEIAENVRACQWLFEFGIRWEDANPKG